MERQWDDWQQGKQAAAIHRHNPAPSHSLPTTRPLAPHRTCGMSPCMAETVKLFCRILSVSQSTLRLVLQKMTA